MTVDFAVSSRKPLITLTLLINLSLVPGEVEGLQYEKVSMQL